MNELMVSTADVDQPVPEADVPAEPVGDVERDASHDAFAEVVEDLDLRGQASPTYGNPADCVRGDVESPLHPRLDGVVDVLDRAVDRIAADDRREVGLGKGRTGAWRHDDSFAANRRADSAGRQMRLRARAASPTIAGLQPGRLRRELRGLDAAMSRTVGSGAGCGVGRTGASATATGRQHRHPVTIPSVRCGSCCPSELPGPTPTY